MKRINSRHAQSIWLVTHHYTKSSPYWMKMRGTPSGSLFLLPHLIRKRLELSDSRIPLSLPMHDARSQLPLRQRCDDLNYQGLLRLNMVQDQPGTLPHYDYPVELRALEGDFKELVSLGGGGIRTHDPLLPKQMRYQTALRPDILREGIKQQKSFWFTYERKHSPRSGGYLPANKQFLQSPPLSDI